MKRLFLIDFNTYLYKSYYSFFGRVDKHGRPTSAIYGFTNFLLKIIAKKDIDYIAVISEDPKPSLTQKDSFWTAATHPMAPQDLSFQILALENIIESLGISLYKFTGFGSDDLFGSIINKLKDNDSDITLFSSNKNLLQLVSKNVRVVNPNQKNITYDIDMINKKFGITPDLIPALFALVGQKGHGVPGVKSLGIKKASALLNRHGSLEKILKHFKDLKPKADIMQIIGDINRIIVGKKIATIDMNVLPRFNLEECALKQFDVAKLSEIFHDLDLIKSLEEISTHKKESVSYNNILTQAQLDGLISQLNKAKEFVIDTETTGIDPMKAALVGIAISLSAFEGSYIPVGHNYLGVPSQLDMKFVMDRLRPILEDEGIKKIGQNIKYDYLIFRNYGIDIKGINFDTMIASFLINPNPGRHNLDDMALDYLKYKTIHTEEIIGKRPNQITMDNIEIEKVGEYACEDADITFRLKNYLEPQLHQKGLTRIFYEVEIPIILVLAKMQFYGVRVDKGYLGKLRQVICEKLDMVKNEIYSIAGYTFNMDSTAQIRNLLLKKLNLIKDMDKKIHADISTLRRLSKKYDIAKKLLEYKSYSSIKRVYIDEILNSVSLKTGRVHISFNQVKAQTGKIFSSNPNLEDISGDIDVMPPLRQGFICEDNNLLISADYLELELRILAHLCGDKNMILSFMEDKDIHKVTAKNMFAVSEENVTEKMRQIAKKVYSCVMEESGTEGLAKEIGVSMEEGAKLMESYFTQYPQVLRYINDAISFTSRNGYAVTILNRIKNFPQIKSQRKALVWLARKDILNFSIKGSVSDIIKLAMIKIDGELRKNNALHSKIIAVTYNEFLFEMSTEGQDITKKIITNSMKNVLKLHVPLKVNIGIGKNWNEARLNLKNQPA